MKGVHIQNSNGSDNAKGFLEALRLSPDEWALTGITVDQGDFPTIPRGSKDTGLLFDTNSLDSIFFGSMIIHVSMIHGLRHECPECGEPLGVKKWVETDYANISAFGMETILRVRVPQLHCCNCGGYHKAECPIVVKGCSYTKLAKIEVAKALSQQTVTGTSRTCHIGKGVVTKILDEAVDFGLSQKDLSDTDTLFIDEIQCMHGQNYVTMIANQRHEAICGVLNNNKESIHEACEWMMEHGLDPKNIQYVSADMSTAYKAGVKECFPNAKLILDKFHIGKGASDTMDKIRKRIIRNMKSKGLDPPTKIKCTVLYRERNLEGKHLDRMKEIRIHNPELALAFDLKEEFMNFLDANDRSEARSRFFSWYNRVRGSKISEMVDFSRRMLSRLNDILRYFDHKITNAVSEGMNNIYKKIKSAAFGYRKPENLIRMCLFRKGNLKVSI